MTSGLRDRWAALPPERRRSWVIAALLLWLFCIVIGAQGVSGGIRIFPDSKLYISAADDVLAGRAPVELVRPYIGYIALIALSKWLGLGLIGVIVFQLGCAIAAAFAIYRLGTYLYGAGAGVIAATLAVVNVHLTQWHISVLTDSLYASCVALVAWSGYEARTKGGRWMWTFIVLVLMGMLIRPTGWLLLPIAACWLVVPRFKSGVTRAGVVALTILAFVLAIVLIAFSRARLEAAQPMGKIEGGVVIPGVWTIDMPESSSDAEGLGAAARYAVENPLASLRLFGTRLLSEFAMVRTPLGFWTNFSILVWLVPFYSLAVLGVKKAKHHPSIPWIVTLIAVHLLFIAIAFSSWDARFLSYIEALIGLFAAVALADMLNLGPASSARRDPRLPLPSP